MYDGSPCDSYNASPLFGLDDGEGQSWPSLFPEYDTSRLSASATANSPGATQASMYNDDAPRQEQFSDLSADTRQHSESDTRPSLASDTIKNQRMRKDLPPIEVDKNDAKAMKRAKNTMAARKSRQKKRDVEESLRHELALMTAQRDRWMHIAISHGAPVPDSDMFSRSAK